MHDLSATPLSFEHHAIRFILKFCSTRDQSLLKKRILAKFSKMSKMIFTWGVIQRQNQLVYLVVFFGLAGKIKEERQLICHNG